MINLLPPQGMRQLKREYWLRILSVWAFLVAALCLIFTLLLIPRFVLTHSQLKQFKSDNSHAAEIESRYAAAEKDIATTNKVIEHLMTPEPRRSVSKILDAVFEERTAHIIYRTISLERKNGAVKKIQVQGEADTRNDLIALRTALERSPLITGVSIPLSDLARDVNLPFTLTISVADEQ